MVAKVLWNNIAIAAMCLALAPPAFANTVISFDDLPGPENVIPNGYYGLTWTNFNYLRASTFASNPSGYLAGLTSGSKLAYSGFTSVEDQAISAATGFQLFSFQMTAAWYDGIAVRVVGSLNGSEVFNQTLNPSATAPTLYDFGGATIDRLLFVSDFNTGTPHPGYSGCCFQFAIDDLTVAGVSAGIPEPTSWAMMLLGFGTIGAALRLRHRGQVLPAG